MKKSLWILILGAIAVGGTTVDRAERMGPTEYPSSRTSEQRKTATFAGGCFWCMEEPFEQLDGVTAVISGYAGGDEEDPSYHQVSAGGTGHAEAVQVHYDPDQITYEGLLEVFWMQINPTDAGGQFVDRGTQYRTEIFYHDDRQKEIAEKSRAALGESGRYEKPIVTPITPLTRFFPAEEYHQDYYKKNPVGYHQYRSGSGRDQYLDKIWGDERNGSHASIRGVAAYRKPSGGEFRAILTPLQYRVTQEEGTEPPFRNEYWDNNAEGIYVDIVSGEPLFSSRDKYKSGTGWPSFTRPLVADSMVQKEDHRLFRVRTELRSKHADSHLGHLFQDGPAPTGLRYCINSASLRFIPREELEAEGFGEFLHLFEK